MQEYEAFTNTVHEIRIKLPSSQSPPYTIHLVLPLSDDGLSEIADTAIDTVIANLQDGLIEAEAVLGDVMKLPSQRMSVSLYFSTALVDFDSVSYDGDILTGAEPMPH